MWFDDIYVNNTALDAPYVCYLMFLSPPFCIHQSFCGRQTLNVSQQTSILVTHTLSYDKPGS